LEMGNSLERNFIYILARSNGKCFFTLTNSNARRKIIAEYITSFHFIVLYISRFFIRIEIISQNADKRTLPHDTNKGLAHKRKS